MTTPDHSALDAAVGAYEQATDATVAALTSRAAADAATIADLRAKLVTPAAYPRPTGLSPLGVPYVPIESLGFGPGVDPNAVIAAMTSPGVLTFPAGLFPIVGFATGYVTGLNIPHGPTQGSNGYCWGIVGSGPGSLDRAASGTYFELQPGSSRLTTAATTGQAFVVKAADVNRVEIGSLRVCGTEQGHAFSGVTLYHPRHACLVYDLAVDGWSGYANVPPGETCGFGIVDLGDGVRRDHLIERVEGDARRRDGKAYGAAPFGGQDMNGSIWNDCYGHDGVASQVGFFRCRNVTTNRLRTARNGTGSGLLSGQGINHEQTTGIVHNWPTIDVPRGNGNTGAHVSHSNYGGSSAFAPGVLTINEPTTLVDGKPAALSVQSWSPYVAANTAAPVVMTAGKPVTFGWAHA